MCRLLLVCECFKSVVNNLCLVTRAVRKIRGNSLTYLVTLQGALLCEYHLRVT